LSQFHLSTPIFGSDLPLEDLTDAYLYWPLHRLVGEGVVRKRNCLIIESYPGTDTTTRYSLVKTWVVPELNLPVRIEKFDRRGLLVRTINAEKVIRQGQLWLASVLSIVPADQSWRSTFTILRGERGLNIPPDEFSPEHVKRLLNPSPVNKAPVSGRPAS
ncbi:MAG: outer membrane lipoprotein-sorting protein, partial [Nevskiales bacterium]